ncbi:hypothetical protein [Kitasatospora sp. NPDC056181]|uniref:hypothetical protein n=1 Tax=Kitasatospora sp. NPDC056181 TaxID=3345737 RepID=UPI0035E005B0
MQTLACADCNQVPKQESTYEYGLHGRWTRRPGGRGFPCRHNTRIARRRPPPRPVGVLEKARAANALLRLCWTCRGAIGGKAGSELELTEKAGPDRLECPQCVSGRETDELGPLLLPAPTKREQMAALPSAPGDPWWEARVLHAKLYPVKDRGV